MVRTALTRSALALLRAGNAAEARAFSVAAPAPPTAQATPAQPPPPPPPPSDKMEVFVNDQPVTIAKGSTVLQACDAAGVDIPRFCYHHRLSIAGNCRMCLVEVEKSPKPVASCAMPAGPGMKIKTDTPIVKKAREGVMEFLLINHPLDCPICDQGGECDLQDQAVVFGSDRSRFTETKRAVDDKNLGPLVKTVMTRCIHCTRCVRFSKEVAGVEDMGVTGRGRDSEIGTYVDKLLTSELSGNVIDLCPVGALTSKPAAFTARSWELKSTESIDVSDGLGANIRVDARGVEVMRILPRLNEAVNEEWLSDRARFQYDALRRQRLDMPMVRGADGQLRAVPWPEAFAAIKAAASKVKGSEMAAVAGKLADAESMMALKDLMHRLGSGNLRHEAGFDDMPADVRSAYISNSGVAATEQADLIVLIGTNPRLECPVFNARIRKAFLDGAQVALLGAPVDLTYPYEHLGTDPQALATIAAGGSFLDKLKAAQRPMIIVGPGVLRRADREPLTQLVHTLVEKGNVVRPGWNGFNVIHDSASRVAALDIGFAPSAAVRQTPNPNPKLVYLLGADDWEESAVPKGAFVVYQGHHGDKGAARADVVLPGCAYTEKAGIYVNFEGRPQTTRAAVPPLGQARVDWTILRALSEVLGKTLPYNDLDGVRARLAEVAPHFAKLTAAQPATWMNGEYVKALAALGGKKELARDVLQTPVANFFMTDAISRASPVMAKCVQARQQTQRL